MYLYFLFSSNEILVTSLVISLGSGGGGSDCAGSSMTCSVGGERCHDARRRWASFLSRTTSWSGARGGREGSAGPQAGTTRPPCGHVLYAPWRRGGRHGAKPRMWFDFVIFFSFWKVLFSLLYLLCEFVFCFCQFVWDRLA